MKFERLCERCGGRIRKRQNQSLSNYNKKRFCSTRCSLLSCEERAVRAARGCRNLNDLSRAMGVGISQTRYLNKKYKLGLEGWVNQSKSEKAAMALMSSLGFRASAKGYKSGCDLMVNGVRVEVKTGKPGKQGWKFNIHRHNGLSEHNVDIYVFRLEGFPMCKQALYMVVPAPIGKKTFPVTIRTLIRKHASYVDNWDAIRSHPNFS